MVVFDVCANLRFFASELPFFSTGIILHMKKRLHIRQKLNKPINLNFADEYLPADVTNMIDVNGLINGLFNSTSTVTGKADISPDYKKRKKIYAGGLSAVPVYVNKKNLKITADANTEVWLEYDFFPTCQSLCSI
ncbi:MAG: hypothetical protein L6V93_18435 [Clostridiales bacterium]|nr:MAG: hypothetical protein L6V93_18435 [Clostridiales bacterium]